jgi:hypothetical protein
MAVRIVLLGVPPGASYKPLGRGEGPADVAVWRRIAYVDE